MLNFVSVCPSVFIKRSSAAHIVWWQLIKNSKLIPPSPLCALFFSLSFPQPSVLSSSHSSLLSFPQSIVLNPQSYIFPSALSPNLFPQPYLFFSPQSFLLLTSHFSLFTSIFSAVLSPQHSVLIFSPWPLEPLTPWILFFTFTLFLAPFALRLLPCAFCLFLLTFIL